jgi:hypothetical protein
MGWIVSNIEALAQKAEGEREGEKARDAEEEPREDHSPEDAEAGTQDPATTFERGREPVERPDPPHRPLSNPAEGPSEVADEDPYERPPQRRPGPPAPEGEPPPDPADAA